MAAILLDVDGVFHVSGQPIPGGADAVRELRSAGHRLRFVTNNTTRPRAQLSDDLRAMGIELQDEELQTTPRTAARALRGKRVLALTMHAIVGELGGIELVGEDAEAVLVGGADETPETNLVFSFMNLARAFHELEAGADLYCLHKNRWWQTRQGPLLDAGAFVAGLEYAAETDATVLGKPSPAYFEAALEALDADANMTWMVGDDIDSDIAGAQKHGMKTVLVRTGKFRPDAVERGRVQPDGIVEIGRIRRSLERYPRFRERCFTEAERAYCDSRANPAESYAGRFAGKEAVGKALGFGVARAFAWKEIEIAGRPKPSVRLSGRVRVWAQRVEAGSIDLSMTHSRELANAVAVVEDG
ncbi:MAG: holo-[acyl-carrier-protein] synthase [Actinobacteria bacterium]|nr:MAG: holo-[acyl-carrier-protein] synthase [Actinomycetota bacterium]